MEAQFSARSTVYLHNNQDISGEVDSEELTRANKALEKLERVESAVGVVRSQGKKDFRRKRETQ